MRSPFNALKFTEVIANKCQALTARMEAIRRLIEFALAIKAKDKNRGDK